MSIRRREITKIWEEALKGYLKPDGNVDLEAFTKSGALNKTFRKGHEAEETIHSEKIEGFVALFDILGFQSLVENNELENVVLAYEKFSDSIDHESYNAIIGDDILRSRIYSDTFLLYTKEVNDRNFKILLMTLQILFLSAITHSIPIRGAITVGELFVSDMGEIGKPIVDAYINEKQQDWIGCWITQECIDRISKEEVEKLMNERSIVQYPIPLKEGQVKELYAFNWLKLITTMTAQTAPVVEGLKDPLKYKFFLKKKAAHGWAEERKHNHTRQFIDFIYSLSKGKIVPQ